MEFIGLRQRIAAATTVEAIEQLCREGDKYLYASNYTRASWTNTANKRLKDLTKQDIKIAPRPVQSKPVNKSIPKKKRNGKDS